MKSLSDCWIEAGKITTLIKDFFKELVKIQEVLGNIKIGVRATSIVQGTINNDENYKRVRDYERDGNVVDSSYSIDITIEVSVVEQERHSFTWNQERKTTLSPFIVCF